MNRRCSCVPSLVGLLLSLMCVLGCGDSATSPSPPDITTEDIAVGTDTAESVDSGTIKDVLPPTDVAASADGRTSNDSAQSTDVAFDGPCPDGHVCGGAQPVLCDAPVEYAAVSTDSLCTAVVHCPPNSVCGSGLAIECDTGSEFAKDPTDETCTPNEQCVEQALCDLGDGVVCAADCVLVAFEVTAETAPTVEKPWVKGTDDSLVPLGLKDAALITMLREYPNLVPDHPAYISVPGPLPADAQFVSHTVTVNATNKGRSAAYAYSGAAEPLIRSTGVFAAPGTVFTVELPETTITGAGLGIEVQVGTHTDRGNVWNFPYGQPIRRFPDIVHRKPLYKRITSMVSAFGGLVYIRVKQGTKIGPLKVTFSNVVRAPYFEQGVTSIEEWKNTISKYPAPWAELATDKVVLTVPTSSLANIDLEPLMAFWVKSMDAAWYLAGIEPNSERAERIVSDPAIEGIAHSGYPIAFAEKWTYALVDMSELKGNQWWTTFHELGHNFQWQGWTFVGLQEATCNLWSLYVLETVGNVPRKFTHPGEEMSDEKRKERIQKYVDEGRDFANNWQQGFNAYQGFIPLEVFMQLQEAFGWSLLHELNKSYRNQPYIEQAWTSEQKIQEWIVRSSQAAGVNLTGLYDDWGFPITEQTKQAIGGLPMWTANPMDAYDQ